MRLRSCCCTAIAVLRFLSDRAFIWLWALASIAAVDLEWAEAKLAIAWLVVRLQVRITTAAWFALTVLLDCVSKWERVVRWGNWRRVVAICDRVACWRCDLLWIRLYLHYLYFLRLVALYLKHVVRISTMWGATPTAAVNLVWWSTQIHGGTLSPS